MTNKAELFERLILMGAVEPAGLDSETGEMLFSFSPNLKNVSPELATRVNDMFSGNIMSLWSKGFVNLEYVGDSMDPFISLTEKSTDDFEVSLLSEIERAVLKNVVNFFGQS